MRVKTTIKLMLLLLLITLVNIQSKAQLVNPNATPEALKLKHFLDSVYALKGKIISGQMDDKYLSYIVANTNGKAPLIIGYDFNGICPSQGGNTDAYKAIKWVKEKGGIAQFNWHWISPDANGDWSTKNYKLSAALADTTSQSYKNLIRDMDLVAEQLKIMQDSGIAVLWRPLHEAEGAWFWWGMSGGDACKKLWHIMYDRYVNYHGINNCIWVWNSYGTTKQNWYPGDAEVDIIAWDYPDYKQDGGSWAQYNQLFGGKNKPFGVGEDGLLTNPNLLENQPWLYFLTWAYMVMPPTSKDGKNPKDWLFNVYNDPRVITLSDVQPGPKAKANPSKKAIDADLNGKESVILDGRASYAPGDSIVLYTWFSENGQVLSNASSTTLDFNEGYHKVRLKVETEKGDTAVAYTSIHVVKVSLAYGKTYKVSSTEGNYGNVASNGIDADLTTRWSSAYSDPQWYQIDLGKRYNIESVAIYWENSSAKNYTIQESNDGENWTTVFSKNNMPAGARIDNLTGLSGGAQFIRFHGTKRNNVYGYSFFEFEVWGTENPNAEPVAEPFGVNSDNDLPKYELYPTLVSYNQNLTLNFGSELKGSLLIYNSAGMLVKQYPLNGNQAVIQIDASFEQGVYLIGIESDQKYKTLRFIVE